MATGVKNSVKDVSATKEPVLCEEMLRMREAYGVPIYRTVEGRAMHMSCACVRTHAHTHTLIIEKQLTM